MSVSIQNMNLVIVDFRIEDLYEGSETIESIMYMRYSECIHEEVSRVGVR